MQAVEKERVVQRLQDLRFEVGAQAVWLADAVPAQFISRTGNP